MRCTECFEEKGEEEACHICQSDMRKEDISFTLSKGTILYGQYIIGKVLGQPGGFGITYLAFNKKLEIKVAIKEYFPRDLAGRASDGVTIKPNSIQDETLFKLGMEQFLDEARLLAKFNHPNIIRVTDFFEENQTAYLVMEYHQGITLDEYVQKNGLLNEAKTRQIIFPILNGLQEIHARGILHRDIKPKNIYITENGVPILLDFGAARQIIQSSDRGLSLVITPGFAPIEQYYKKGKQGAWTDIYACAATIYYMLTGQSPKDSHERMINKEPILQTDLMVSSEMRNVLEKGMALLPEDRFQSVQEILRVFSNETIKMSHDQIAATLVLANSPMSSPPVVSEESPKKNYVFIIAFILLIICSGGGYYYYQYTHNPVNLLAKNGVTYTESSFFNAIKIGDSESVKLFLQAGMSVNQIQNDTGNTPIMIAIESNQQAIFSFLISKGADLKLKDQKGNTPLDLAVKQGNPQIIKQLMDQLKINADYIDDTEKSLLDKAITSGNIATVKFFIEQGANINKQDDQGNTILDRMLETGNQPMAAVLKSAGAKRNINKNFAFGKLNEIKLPYSSTTSFEVDLLNNGIGQTVTVDKTQLINSYVTISQESKQLNSFNIYGSTYQWFVAYLRDDNTPDLVYFYVAGSGGFINDFKIIGKTGNGTVGVLFEDRIGLARDVGSGARLSINGKQLVVTSLRHQVTLDWVDNYFRVNRQY